MKKSIISALSITVFLLLLYYFWYMIADREILFLYWHLGYEPFSEQTIGRYFMSGLVASGFLFWGYTIIQCMVKKRYAKYKLPQWSTVWEYTIYISAIPLFIILNILGNPPIPLMISIGVLGFLYIGVGIVLWSSDTILKNVKKSMRTITQSITIVPLFILPLYLTYHLKKNPGNIFNITLPTVLFFIGSLLFSLAIQYILKRLKKQTGTPNEIFFFALLLFYIFLPLVHYIFMGPTLFSYITDSSNFFSNNVFIQGISFFSAYGTTILAKKFASKKLSPA